MTKKEMIIIIGAIFLISGMVLWIVPRTPSAFQNQELRNNTTTVVSQNEIIPTYKKEVPRASTLTPPKKEIAIVSVSAKEAKEKTFDLKITKAGFIPETFTIKKDDTMVLNVSAEDGSYDFDISSLGAYFPVIMRGETKKIAFEAHTAGTFVFLCRDACPSKKITGSLIVLP